MLSQTQRPKMELNANEVLEVLREKGVSELYHANTIVTSSTFLRQSQLLARGVADEAGLLQTSQQTDDEDKKYGLWYDLFLDTVDIHDKKGGRNFYGPVLFCFDAEVLAEDWLATVWVTKKNPQHWKDADSHSDRYFTTVRELRDDFGPNDFGSMLVMRSIGGKLRLNPYLKRIEIDDPGRELDGVNLRDYAVGALQVSHAQTKYHPDFEYHSCPSDCGCKEEYENMRRETILKFFGITEMST